MTFISCICPEDKSWGHLHCSLIITLRCSIEVYITKQYIIPQKGGATCDGTSVGGGGGERASTLHSNFDLFIGLIWPSTQYSLMNAASNTIMARKLRNVLFHQPKLNYMTSSCYIIINLYSLEMKTTILHTLWVNKFISKH